MKELHKKLPHRVLVVGANGMLGRETVEAARAGSGWLNGIALAGCDLEEIDITNPASVTACLSRRRPELVINCAAYTNVDKAEAEPAAAYAVNAEGPGHLARACSDISATLVHISTDFVFDGRASEPYVEEDRPGPISVYGASKLAGEMAVRAAGPEHLIIRISWLFGRYGPNFVRTILRLAEEKPELTIVADQVGSPTYAPDVVEAIGHLLAVGAAGVVHFHNAGQCSWYEFARHIVQLSGRETVVRPVPTGEFPRPARRPAWSVMSLARYEALTGKRPRPWPEALAAYLALLDQQPQT